MSCFKNKDFDHRHVAAKYVQRYLSLNCSAEMQGLGLFPNLKEIQEAFGIYNILEGHVFKQDPAVTTKSANIHAYVIGDGCTPRCAGVLAFMTKWRVVSVDPDLRVENFAGKVNRLWLHKGKGEDVHLYKIDYETPSHVILIFPHSHITNTNEVYKHFKDKKCWIINMPCCYPKQDNSLPLNWSTVYRDKAINTDKNLIRIYNNYL